MPPSEVVASGLAVVEMETEEDGEDDVEAEQLEVREDE